MAETAGFAVARDGAVATLRIDRPQLRNALTDDVLAALAAALEELDRDPEVRCLVVAGSEKVFASGADLRALAERDPVQAYAGDRARAWRALRGLSTPLVAAVSGYCLGGGLELAMHADLLIASETAKFGLPETSLGLIPGAGGTQLLTHAVGKPLAMDMILTGRQLGAEEAERAGLVSRVTAAGEWLRTAQEAAAEIARRPAVAQRLARESVANSFEMGLQAGIDSERRAFAMAFATADAREGIAAFLEKRDPRWSHG